MGHYDDQYDDEYKRRREERQKYVVTEYFKYKNNIDNVDKLVSELSSGGKSQELKMAFNNFKAHLNNFLVNENIMHIDQKFILDKLTKE